MNKITHSIILIALLLTGCKKETIKSAATNNAPKPSIEWFKYHIGNSALPNNQVNAIVIDKNDIKWLGTSNGLVKIDGDKWTVFNTSNTRLPSSNIRAIALGNEGALWVGTDQGLVHYKDNQWTAYTSKNSVLTTNSITCITYNVLNKTTWIGTDEGIVKIDKDNNWHYIFVNELVLSITTDGAGNLWTGVFNPYSFVGKIKRYANGNWTTYNLAEMDYPSSFPYALAADDNGHIFAVLSGTAVQSLIKYNGNSWQEVERPEKARGLKSILLDKGKIWVGGNNLSFFGNRQTECLTIPDGGFIQSMAKDSKGKKWLGTLTGLVALSGF
ncbi:MAG: two-component regulator propeller domain-containing protein [Bacteroidota bacterium]